MHQYTRSAHRYSVSLQTAPQSEPVTFSEMQTHIRDVPSGDQTFVESLITAAREWCEQYTRRAFITQTWLLSLDSLPGGRSQWWEGVRQMAETELRPEQRWVDIPYPPLITVNSVTIYNQDDSPTTVSTSTYYVDSNTEPGRVLLRFGETWPGDSLRIADAFQVDYDAGYGANASDVPGPIKEAIKRMVAYMYEHRGDCSAEDAGRKSGATLMLDMYRIRGI